MTASISSHAWLANAPATFPSRIKRELASLSFVQKALLVSGGVAVAAGISYLGYKWATAEKLSDPSTVQTIYTPPHPSATDLANLRQYVHKIARLKENLKVMGIAFAANEKGGLTPIYIRCDTTTPFTTCFTAYNLADDTTLGFALTYPFLKSNQYLKFVWPAGQPEEYIGYGPSQEEVSKVLLDQVTNQSAYKNIGVILNKAIHQKFAVECQGRIILDAVRNTQPYHYKMGFRAKDPAQNSLYAQYVRNHEIPSKDHGRVTMYLPERARQLWLAEIDRHPICFPI